MKFKCFRFGTDNIPWQENFPRSPETFKMLLRNEMTPYIVAYFHNFIHTFIYHDTVYFRKMKVILFDVII